MKDGESMDEYAGKLSGMISKYSSLGVTLEDSVLVRKLLDTVPDNFLQLVASIEQTEDLDTMLFDEAIGRMKAYEERLKSRSTNKSSDTSLLFSKSENHQSMKGSGRTHFSSARGRGERGGRNGLRGRGSSRGRGGRWGGGSSQEAGNSYRKPRDKRYVKCFNCEDFGHYASECKGEKEKGGEAHLAQKLEEVTLLLSVCGAEHQPWCY
ncbi:hypothetical protein QVD17_18951 [Tagetes erecta]|uniref:CCHC-type domain-containing protein n=1 Tax=Tagetes erecta TaxID=13708 RepID=A0AAD8NPI7_TARER|nr:hypothetical protein QVD17_18951 [Tagetes erecta]